MTRELLLSLSRQAWVRRWMETSPVFRKFTHRFVAGETLEDELKVCARLANAGYLSSVDHLGENVTSVEEGGAARDAYMQALDQISARGLPATISLKLTQMGLDFSEESCLENVRALARRASAAGTRVEIDMESTAYTDRTLKIVEQVAEECGCVRAVIQAYLFRSADDIKFLNSLHIPVRLCKGAYLEPHTAAFAAKADVDRTYLTLMKMLLDNGTYPALATHDERIQGEALRYARERGLPKDRFEFQMLYGIRRDLQKRLVDQGYRVRLYVPYGTAWYAYFMRRLAERPANLLFLIRNIFR
ncbi:MAG: proline dehydrogenase family protein [Bryobacterales bacterium]|nr:proline dehydrogenase family protein [Bryobacterales bacterium]MBV9401190.1 proline dehydrogenase family protein [Bryobacterales bacterium]